MGTTSRSDNNVVVSVIIPAYNEEEYVQDCVVSVFDQQFDQEFEVLVCDDSSSDQTYEVLKSLEVNREELQVLKNSENRGIIDTVTRLTETASGRFLLRIDADSVLLPGTIQAMYDAFDGDADLVFGRVEVKNTNYLHPTAAAIGKRRGRGTWYGGACIGVNREKFVSTGGFKTNMVGAEVQELKQRARLHDWTVIRLDKHGVESNFPVEIWSVLRRKLDSGRTHINQYIEAPETYSIWELRGAIFWTVIFILTILSILIPPSSPALLLLLLPIYQYSGDVRLAVAISGRKSFILLYPAYQMLSGILRAIGVWSTIDNVFILLWQKYLL